MTTWKELSKDQKAFLRTHLKFTPLAIFGQSHTSAENKAIIAAYGDYKATRALYLTALGGVPTDHGLRNVCAPIFANAEALFRDGKFTEASDALAGLIPSLNRASADIGQQVQILRNAVAPFDLTGTADVEVQAINAARQNVLGHLTATPPTLADLNAARNDYVTYRNAVDEATRAMGEVPHALNNLQLAELLTQPLINQTLALNLVPLALTPQSQTLVDAKSEAEALNTLTANVPRNDSKAMDAVTARLNTFAAQNAANVILPQAIQHIVDQVTAAFTAVQVRLTQARDADLKRYDAQAEHGEMVELKKDITQHLISIGGKMAGRDPIDLAEADDLILQANRKADRLFHLLGSVGTRMFKADLASKGAKEAHQTGIMKLAKSNPAAAQKVIEILAADTAKLGGTPATPDFIRDQKKDVATKGKALRDAKSARKSAEEYKTTFDQNFPLLEQELATLNTQAFISTLTPTEQARRELLTKELPPYKQRAEANEQSIAGLKRVETTARNAFDSSVDKLDTAKKQRALLDAVTFGPLSPDAAHPIPADMVEDVAELFGKNPELAQQTCALTATAKDPKSMAQMALRLADECDAGFGHVGKNVKWGAATSEAYAKSLLNRTAFGGAEFAAQANDALDRGVHHDLNPKLSGVLPTRKQAAKLRATEAADAMFADNTDGTINLTLDGPAFNTILERQKFSRHGQREASTMMNAEMEKLQTFFADPTDGAERKKDAEKILNSIDKVPGPGPARTLLQQSMGISDADINDPAKEKENIRKMRVAVLKSMVTPVSQGKVGSCFATAPLLKLRNDDPIAVMEMYTDIVTKGTIKPKGGPVQPAVVRVQAEDDPLSRSLEYSLASAGASLAKSSEREVAEWQTFHGKGSLKELEPVLGKTVSKPFLKDLKTEIQDGMAFSYQPLKDTPKSADGSSSKGLMCLKDTETGALIENEADYLTFLKAKATKVANAQGLDANQLADIHSFIDDPKFVASIKASGYSSLPWEQQAGGRTNEVYDVIYNAGGQKQSDEMVPKAAATATGDRGVEVLTALGKLRDKEMATATTGGIHAFNLLPPSGDYLTLVTGDVDANVKKMLIEPGKKIKDTPMSKERAIYLYDKQMESMVDQFSDESEKNMVRAAFQNRPDKEMTPGELEAHISDQLNGAKQAATDRRALKWFQDQTPTPTNPEMKKQRTKERARQDKKVTNAVASALVAEIKVPAFVIADSNWGDEADHRNFVIATNPITGKAEMWKQSVVTGEMALMDEEWLNTNWNITHEPVGPLAPPKTPKKDP